MHEGISDYLEIMHLAGLSDLNMATERTRRRIREPATVSPDRQQVAPPSLVECISEVMVDDSAAIPASETTDGTLQTAMDSSKAGQLRRLAEEVAQCTQCRELASSRKQTVFGVGNPDSPLVFLGEAPGADEDKQGEPFVGRAGQLLTDIITKGMKVRREDVYICNILRCRPPGNRTPLPEEAGHCRPFLDRTLEIIKPKFICCLGAVAAKNLLDSEKSIGALRGKVWDYNEIKVICTYHPAYLLRNPAAKKDTWEDIQLLMREMSLHFR